MSNENEVKKDILLVEDMTGDLRSDNFQIPVVTQTTATATTPMSPFVKPKINLEQPLNQQTNITEALSPEALIQLSKLIETQTKKTIREQKFNPNLPGQVISKEAAPITDFSKISMADIYDLSIPIEAKPFMSADVLAINLRDTNYEARWVNKNPQRLGDMIAKGFTFIEPKDLQDSDGIQTGLDAEGHYCYNDVVAMKIDKATYYPALRAAHMKAVATTDTANSRKRGASMANAFMQHGEAASDFASARTTGKVQFYDPGIEA